MTMAARCPSCGTLFRVTPEQLAAHDGDVRCGRCFAVFNGFRELSMPAAETAAPETQPVTSPEVRPAVSPDAAVAAKPDAASPADETSIAAAPAAEVPPPVTASDAPSPEREIRDEAAPTLSELADTEPAIVPAPVEQDSAAPIFPYVPEVVSSADIVPGSAPHTPELAGESPAVRSARELATDESSAIAWQKQSPPLVPPVNVAGGQPPAAPIAPGTFAPKEGTPVAPALDPDFLADDAARIRRHRRLWGGGALILVFVIVAQLVYLFRVDLAARYPSFKPFLTGACQALHCKVPLPQQPESVAIESSDLRATDPAHPDRVAVSVTLRNRGSMTMGYPALDLTLTDGEDRPVARRVFMPAQYLKPDQDAQAGIAPNAEVSVRLTLDIAGLDASGFRMEVLPTSGA